MAVATPVASIHHTWLPRGSLDGQTVHITTGEKVYYLLWGITTLPGDRLNLPHLYCFIIDAPGNGSLGCTDFQKGISAESDSANFFLRNLGFIQILHMSFSALPFSYLLEVPLPLYRHDWHGGQSHLDPPKPLYFTKTLPYQGAQKSHWCFI